MRETANSVYGAGMKYRSVLIAALSTVVGIAVVQASSAYSAFTLARSSGAKPLPLAPPDGVSKARVDRVLSSDAGPVVLLRPLGQAKLLPIWIGTSEARAIVRAQTGVRTLRPMTHALLDSVVERLGASVHHVRVDELRSDGVFVGTVVLEQDGKAIEVDARPSDAIPLALRVDAPIYVSDELSEHMLDAEY